MKKRLLLFILSAILILTPTVYSVDLSPADITYVERLNYLSGAEIDAEIEKHVDIDALYDYLAERLALCEEVIDVSAFGLPATDEVKNNLSDLIYYGMPEAFHVYGMGLSSKTNINKIYIGYTCDASEYGRMLNECKTAAALLLDGLFTDELTDAQKALIIHDRMATFCQYDSLFTYQYDSYNIYGFLTNRHAVCQGYAAAYMYLLDLVGIDSYICMSDALNPAWNILKIDGSYYYADVTWDDPTYDIGGRVNHDNFLVSYSELYAQGHKAGDFDTSHNNTGFDGSFWKKSAAAFTLLDGVIYYVDNTDGYIRDYSGKIICSIDARWAAGPNSYWIGNFTRLATDGEYLYYSQPRGVYRLDPVTRKSTLLWTPSLLKNGTAYNVFGLYYDNGTLYAEVTDEPNYTSCDKTGITESYLLSLPEYKVTGTLTNAVDRDVTYSVTDENGAAVKTITNNDGGFSLSLPSGKYTLTVTAEGYSDYTLEFTIADADTALDFSISPVGDLNGDDVLDTDDAIYLLYYVTLGEGYPVTENCDYNGDGVLDADDAIYLLYHIMLGDRFPLN